MEKELLYSLMDSSNNFSQETASQLKNLIDKHPYFQGARILFLKNLKFIGSSDLENSLQCNASLVPCRQHLYKTLNPTISTTPNTQPTEEKETEVSIKNEPITKESSTNADSSFVLLEGNNEIDAVTINLETTPNSSDNDILELIEGDVDLSITDQDIDKKNFNNLIDVFLNSNPKINRPTMPAPGEIIENEDISLDSIVESEELASEPLAQIYISQGYFDKAIAVYEKLCLKYPEKNSYFADQIRNIEEKKNSKH
ncbi:MAG: tetratricopeptide repeat protein [Bacteroidales bacterium]